MLCSQEQGGEERLIVLETVPTGLSSRPSVWPPWGGCPFFWSKLSPVRFGAGEARCHKTQTLVADRLPCIYLSSATFSGFHCVNETRWELASIPTGATPAGHSHFFKPQHSHLYNGRLDQWPPPRSLQTLPSRNLVGWLMGMRPLKVVTVSYVFGLGTLPSLKLEKKEEDSRGADITC